MKTFPLTKISERCLTCTVMVLLSFCLIGAAEEPLALTADLPLTVVRFSVLTAEMVIHNEGAKPETILSFPTDASDADLTVEIKNSRSGETVYRGKTSLPGRVVKEVFRQPVTLRPGESSRFRATMACRWTADGKLIGPIFDKVGSYKLIFSCQVQRRQTADSVLSLLTSSPIEITVTEVGVNEAAGFQRVQKLSRPALILDPGGALRELSAPDQLLFAEELRSLVNDIPSSPWTRLAKFALATILKEQAFARGNLFDRAMLQEALDYVSPLADSPDFPYSVQARSLRNYLTKTLVTSSASQPAKAGIAAPTNISGEAKDNILQGLQKMISALRNGNAEGFAQLLTTNFVMNDRIDRSKALEGLAGDSGRLNAVLDVQVELLSAQPDGADYIVEARFRFKSKERVETQDVRLKGLFSRNEVQLKRWNRIASNIGAQPE